MFRINYLFFFSRCVVETCPTCLLTLWKKSIISTSKRPFTPSPPPRRWADRSFVIGTKHSWRRSWRKCGSLSASTMRLKDSRIPSGFDVCKLSQSVFSSLHSLKISSAPSGHLRCSLSSCAFSTCCLVCCSSSASPPLPWCVIALWVWSWCPCWRGPSFATLADTETLEGPSTKQQVLFWSRWV